MAAVITELQSLCETVNTKISTLVGFGTKLDNVERCIVEMNGSVDAVQKSFAYLQQDITVNTKQLTKAKGQPAECENGAD